MRKTSSNVVADDVKDILSGLFRFAPVHIAMVLMEDFTRKTGRGEMVTTKLQAVNDRLVQEWKSRPRAFEFDSPYEFESDGDIIDVDPVE